MRRLPVIGIGEDGWTGLATRAREHLRGAARIVGAERQLALLPGGLVPGAREPWPSPMLPRVQELAALVASGDPRAHGTVVLASGDPMLHGVGATLARYVDPVLLDVVPAPSAYSLACARLGWPAHEVPLVSLVADPRHDPVPALAGGRAIIYVAGAGGARRLAACLRAAGLGHARLTILARLGGPAEHRVDACAATFDDDVDPLHLVAVDTSVRAASPPGSLGEPAPRLIPVDPRERRLASRVPGLPDALYAGDGQLTRADVRAVALAALAPSAGELLWDVGAGSGTIAIEWCRAAPRAAAIAIERRADRCATIAENARQLGAAGVRVVEGAVPPALDGLEPPDAIFLGGSPSQPGLIDRCWTALRPGGRLVANAVTFEGERALVEAQARLGGRLVRLDHAHVGSLGSFTAWRPERSIVLWAAERDPLARDDRAAVASAHRGTGDARRPPAVADREESHAC